MQPAAALAGTISYIHGDHVVVEQETAQDKVDDHQTRLAQFKPQQAVLLVAGVAGVQVILLQMLVPLAAQELSLLDTNTNHRN